MAKGQPRRWSSQGIPAPLPPVTRTYAVRTQQDCRIGSGRTARSPSGVCTAGMTSIECAYTTGARHRATFASQGDPPSAPGIQKTASSAAAPVLFRSAPATGSARREAATLPVLRALRVPDVGSDVNWQQEQEAGQVSEYEHAGNGLTESFTSTSVRLRMTALGTPVHPDVPHTRWLAETR